MGTNEESKLKLLREESGISRKELARKCGISFRTLQDYEQGHKDIFSAKAETLFRLSRALDCGMEELLQEKDKKNVCEEMNVKCDWMIRVDDRCFCVEMMTPPDRARQKHRLMLYYSRLINQEFEPLEKHIIKSPEYKVEGKWKMIDGNCYLQFWYEDSLVSLPFDMDFTEEMIPWLIEVAGLKIDYYFRGRKHWEQGMITGGEAWNES